MKSRWWESIRFDVNIIIDRFFFSWTSTYQDRLTMAPLPQYLKHWDEELVQLFEQWWTSLLSSYKAVILLCNKMISFAWTFEMPGMFLLLFCHQSVLVQCEHHHLFSIDQWIICQMATLYRPISMCLSHQCRCSVSSSSFVLHLLFLTIFFKATWQLK